MNTSEKYVVSAYTEMQLLRAEVQSSNLLHGKRSQAENSATAPN
jgi:hypothetical protein